MKRILFLLTFVLFGIPSVHAATSPPAVEGRRSPAIVMYVKSGCPYCEKLEKYFADRNIPVSTRNIMQDADAWREYRERYHGEIVPLTVFGNDEHIVDGCDMPAIRRAMEAYGLPAD